MTNIIEVSRLAKHYGRSSALRDLNLKVAAGEFIALFGRNGAGKTTFLKILAGLSRPSSGTFSVNISEGSKRRYARGSMGYLSHNTSLYVDLTALENLRFYARMLDMPCDDHFLIERIAEVGLEGREREPVRNYSRGMQQRLAIARAFLHNPGILLLDEPFTGLDQAGSDFLHDYLSRSRTEGKICIMAIHDAALGYDIADRLVIIERGVAALDVSRASLTLAEFQEKYKAITQK